MTRPEVPHYQQGGIEPVDFILANELDFASGNVVKYITRWRYKDGIKDLVKARSYIDFLIEHENSKKDSEPVVSFALRSPFED